MRLEQFLHKLDVKGILLTHEWILTFIGRFLLIVDLILGFENVLAGS